jgi:hypothetical protein
MTSLKACSSSIQHRDRSPSPDSSAPPCKRRKRSVGWADPPEMVQHKENDCYENTQDIWYSREDYKQFHMDRLRTVEYLRASGGDEHQLNPEFYCCRGLEPFMTRENHCELSSKRKLHKSTIILEQARQNLLQITDPDCFRRTVTSQSEIALRRAQELAALDQYEIYKTDRFPLTQKTEGKMPSSTSSSSSCCKMPSLSLSHSQPLRTLQEWNAQRLMNIYAGSQHGRPSFRFPIRRDSLNFLNTMMMDRGGRKNHSFLPTTITRQER